MAIDFGHDQWDLLIHPPGTRIIDHEATLFCESGGPLFGNRPSSRKKSDVGFLLQGVFEADHFLHVFAP